MKTQPTKSEIGAQIYKNLNAESVRHGERNDCTVIALTACSHSGNYIEAMEALEIGSGRVKGTGCHIHDDSLDLLDLRAEIQPNFTHDMLEKIKEKTGKRPKTLTMSMLNRHPELLPEGRYMIFSRGHVSALRDGAICDWSRESRRVVHYALKIVPRNTPQAHAFTEYRYCKGCHIDAIDRGEKIYHWKDIEHPQQGTDAACIHCGTLTSDIH